MCNQRTAHPRLVHSLPLLDSGGQYWGCHGRTPIQEAGSIYFSVLALPLNNGHCKVHWQRCAWCTCIKVVVAAKAKVLFQLVRTSGCQKAFWHDCWLDCSGLAGLSCPQRSLALLLHLLPDLSSIPSVSCGTFLTSLQKHRMQCNGHRCLAEECAQAMRQRGHNGSCRPSCSPCSHISILGLHAAEHVWLCPCMLAHVRSTVLIH